MVEEFLVLGIDCGGTHTDAALLLVNEKNRSARLLAGAKTETLHENLPASILNVINELSGEEGNAKWLNQLERITLGTTLAINSIVQNKEDAVGLAVAAGPGLDPAHFTLGEHVCIVPGGLDHRGIEVEKLYLKVLERDAMEWKKQGIKACACVGKFSPRNPEHEQMMSETIRQASNLPVSQGHKLSGALNFPRRIATAYYNAAIMRLHNDFLDSVERTISSLGADTQCRLLKADGGAIPFNLSRKQPVQSLLSGPAASVMGMQALNMAVDQCAILLDIGGTTTDISLVVDNSPVLDRNGMKVKMRRTLVKTLASHSIGIGGDSLIKCEKTAAGWQIQVGPQRIGPAMAFGGKTPTLLDALNVLDGISENGSRGNGEASLLGIKSLLGNCEDAPRQLSKLIVDKAIVLIIKAVYDLIEDINSRPIYTLSGLKNIREARPLKACIAGGPAESVAPLLQKALGLPVEVSPYPDIANALGAALTIPTASLEIYIDGARQTLSAPSLGIKEQIRSRFTLEDAKKRACELLSGYLDQAAVRHNDVEVTEADLFAVLDDYGRGSVDMRVTSQIRPGICAYVR